MTTADPVIDTEFTAPAAKTPVVTTAAPAWPSASPTDVVPNTPVTDTEIGITTTTSGVFVAP